MKMNSNSSRLLNCEIRFWKPHTTYRLRSNGWRVKASSVYRRGCRGWWHDHEALFLTARVEGLGSAVSDGCGVFPPQREYLCTDRLVISPLGVLTETAWDVEEENEDYAERQSGKGENCEEKLEGLVGKAGWLAAVIGQGSR
jgi:hypothetical protein